jgi:hypothetical protein
MQEEALKLASHMTHPVTVAAFALVFAAFALRAALKGRTAIMRGPSCSCAALWRIVIASHPDDLLRPSNDYVVVLRTVV